MGEPPAICRVDEIPEGAARGFALPGALGRELRVFVVRRSGALYAYLNRCPHRGTPLDWLPDRFLDREGRHLVCATHGAVFRVEDGACLAGPCAGDRLTAFPVKVRHGAVYPLSAPPPPA